MPFSGHPLVPLQAARGNLAQIIYTQFSLTDSTSTYDCRSFLSFALEKYSYLIDMVIETRKTRFVCISDTHNSTFKLPAGDVLVHAGDLTKQGTLGELRKTIEWIEKSNFEIKILVAGTRFAHLKSYVPLSRYTP